MAQQLTPRDLQQYIDEYDIQARLIADIGDTPTVPAAAAALGVTPEQIVKTLLFLVQLPDQSDGEPVAVVVISNGESRVDRKPLSAHFGVGRKRIKLAPAAVVLDLLGYPAGGVPPFGHRTSLPVILDAAILDLKSQNRRTIYGGGGDDRTMLELSIDELVRTVQPTEILSVS